MRILFTRFPYASAHGGAEIQTLSLLQELERRGHKVAFMGSCPTLLVMCKQFRIAIHKVDIGKPPVSIAALLRFFVAAPSMRATLAKAWSVLRQEGIDVVCMLSLSEKILLTPIALATGTKVVWIEHDSVGRWLRKNPYLRTLLRYSRSVTTITVSELSRQKYIQLGWPPEKVQAIANGIDTTRYATTAPKTYRDTTQIHVGCVARLAYEKGIDILIDSVQDLPTVSVSIVGIGPEKQHLQERIDVAGAADRIRILDRKGTLIDFYLEIDLLVLPSRSHDPFGLVAAEAMCVGTPVIVTTACGIAHELTHNEHALVAQAGSVSSLTEMIQHLQAPAERTRIAEAGKQKANASFTIQSMGDAYEAVLLG